MKNYLGQLTIRIFDYVANNDLDFHFMKNEETNSLFEERFEF